MSNRMLIATVALFVFIIGLTAFEFYLFYYMPCDSVKYFPVYAPSRCV